MQMFFVNTDVPTELKLGQLRFYVGDGMATLRTNLHPIISRIDTVEYNFSFLKLEKSTKVSKKLVVCKLVVCLLFLLNDVTFV